ncbi:hypothetical protein GCM10009677_30720 [Sphaerisporangium rubeum]|uniref:Putative alkaline shock family protein YloU n=1 Tax=Sphaerisporangium rubeum TaxID=321317 RepID=A0A7X0ICX7_9ACTN|nr:Asp23/Gls24 family envelope stress response protein [Sphaerisporangium rubeum]MBB6472690.1 putative alkaline shock family protein YloU [Sphaerisporangium rubeum]
MSAGPAGIRAPEERGRTRISGKVLERIAATAAAEVDEAGRAVRRVLGVPVGHDTTSAPPRVSGHIDGGLAMLRIHLSVAYPAPVREVTRRVRDHVTDRVHALTGLDVRQVDIDVDRLLPGANRDGEPAGARERLIRQDTEEPSGVHGTREPHGAEEPFGAYGADEPLGAYGTGEPAGDESPRAYGTGEPAGNEPPRAYGTGEPAGNEPPRVRGPEES